MTSPVYDPRKCEFVARMGRIPRPDSSRRKKEKIPVTFRIPDPPDQESFKTELDQESVCTDRHQGSVADHSLHGSRPESVHNDQHQEIAVNSNSSLHDSRSDLPSTQSHQSYEYTEKLTEEQQAFQRSQLDKMAVLRRQQAREKELEFMAQQLVNQSLLGKELSEMRRRDEMLRHIRHKAEAPRPRDGRNVSIHVQKVQPEVSDELMGYIRRELERLMPIAKQEKKK